MKPIGPLRLPNNLPEPVHTIAAEAAVALVAYQNVAYAQLYLDRLVRFTNQRTLDPILFGRIAELMAIRMMYEDSFRMAQLAIVDRDSGMRECKFRFDELISALPQKVAIPLLRILRLLGWPHHKLKRKFVIAGRLGESRLRLEASMRYWRMLTLRHAVEGQWIALWLHMIDRSMARQPSATSSIVESATMVHGHGDAYNKGLTDWHLIMSKLAKPTFDGTLLLPDLAEAITRSRSAAAQDGLLTSLEKTIVDIRGEADESAIIEFQIAISGRPTEIKPCVRLVG